MLSVKFQHDIYQLLYIQSLCDELITCPEESYRLWCVIVCDLETSRMRRPWSTLGRSAMGKKERRRRSTYRVVPPDDEQYVCSKHAEVSYWNKLTVNSASCWFLLYGLKYLSGSHLWLYVVRRIVDRHHLLLPVGDMKFGYVCLF